MVSPLQTSDPLIFDRHTIRKSRERTISKFQDHDFLFTWSAKQLLTRLRDIKRTFPLTLQIGSRYPLFLQDIGEKAEHIVTLDCTPFPVCPCTSYIQAEEEILPIAPNSLDLVISNLNLHSVNDLPGTLVQICSSLKPDGLFLATLLGGETLHELRDVLTQTELNLRSGTSPRVAPFADKPQMGALLQRAGFALPVIDSEILTVTYSNIFSLMHDLRYMGENNAIMAREKTFPGKDFFMDAAKRYQDTYSEPDGRITATFEIIFLIGWAPDPSQQKPLKPGSAKHSLAKALGTKETKL